jgi:thioredoxin-like negative regulator of GroEL
MILQDISTLDEALLKPMTLVVTKTHTCSVCQNIVPYIKERVPAFDQLNLIEIYMDDFDELKGKFMVFTVPTVMLYHEGKEILRESRFINTDKINRLIEMMQ